MPSDGPLISPLTSSSQTRYAFLRVICVSARAFRSTYEVADKEVPYGAVPAFVPPPEAPQQGRRSHCSRCVVEPVVTGLRPAASLARRGREWRDLRIRVACARRQCRNRDRGACECCRCRRSRGILATVATGSLGRSRSDRCATTSGYFRTGLDRAESCGGFGRAALSRGGSGWSDAGAGDSLRCPRTACCVGSRSGLFAWFPQPSMGWARRGWARRVFRRLLFVGSNRATPRNQTRGLRELADGMKARPDRCGLSAAGAHG